MNIETLPSVSQHELATSSQTASAIAEIQTAYVMAVQRPRDIDRARLRILDHCKRYRFAEPARWIRKVGKDKQGNDVWKEGLSIRAAEALQCAFGNMRSQTIVIYEDDDKRIILVSAVDLETNSHRSKQAIITKTIERKWAKGRDVIGERINSEGDKVFLVKAYDNEVDQKTGMAAGKLLRDCILPLIPADIRDEMLDAILDTISKDAEVDPLTARKRLVDGFLALGVTPEQIKEFLHHAIDTVTTQEIVQLRGMYEAIKHGEARWEDFLPVDVKPEPKRASLDLGAMTPGDPETHTEPGEVQAQKASGPVQVTASALWADFNSEWLDKGATREQLTAVEKEACAAFDTKKVARIDASMADKFQAWLADGEHGAIAILAEMDVQVREPGEEA